VIVQLVGALLPPLIPLIKLVGQVFTSLMPALVPLINLLVDILVPVLKLLIPVIGALTPIINVLAAVIVAIITPIAAFVGWLATLLDKASTWKAVGKFFTDVWKDIVKAFTDGWKWVTDKWDAIVDYAKGIPKRITDAVGDLGSLLWNKGKDLVTGLWNGITGMGKWLADKISGWVKDVIPGPIAKALGINSPSKVAAELAQWVPAGIAKGMDDNLDQVLAASTRLASAMLPAAGNVGAVGLAGLVPGSGGGPLMPPISVGAGQPSRIIVENHVHTHTYLDGKQIHTGLIPVAQQYKGRTGTTGLS
jgi:phage-related protein